MGDGKEIQATEPFHWPMANRLDTAMRAGFHWGNDEMDAAQGRGWAVLKDDELDETIFFRGGDSSGFVAEKQGEPPPKSKKVRR